MTTTPPIEARIPSHQLVDDFDLLDLMTRDTKAVGALYQPGPFWQQKTVSAVRELKRFGIANFRGSTNSAATSYGDNAYIDTRGSYDFGVRSLLVKIYRDIYPFRNLFDSQVALTRHYFDEVITLRNQFFSKHDRVTELLSNYTLPSDTTRGGCLSKGTIHGSVISHHYLQLLDTLDYILRTIDIRSVRSYFEIGGGFGVNVHLLLSLFPHIRKVIYLDIPPNLYVGTQYLKSFFGDRVIDYKCNRHMRRLVFSHDDTLEIFCITPSQIERIESAIDLFHNAHSFVEMPLPVVKNYARHVERVLARANGRVALVSYDRYDLQTTIHPDSLPNLFSRNFDTRTYPSLNPDRVNHFYTST